MSVQKIRQSNVRKTLDRNVAKPMKTLQWALSNDQVCNKLSCYPTEMAIRLRIALVACLALFVQMEVISTLAGGEEYKKLEARVQKLENALCGAELDCKRKATSLSKYVCKKNQH